eukprot:SAG11_NODE_41024_length_199_cov_10.140000_1_plen_55_part_10
MSKQLKKKLKKKKFDTRGQIKNYSDKMRRLDMLFEYLIYSYYIFIDIQELLFLIY